MFGGDRGSEGSFEVERGVKLVVKRARDGTIVVEAQARTEADLRLLLRDFAEVVGGLVGGVEEKRPGPASARRG
ncbi:MAG: hypothetical protein NZ938_01485 [Aigarchaeota archaeon]|nr:hypothetical protein [Candidatus Calditenuaceae archaeon]